MLKEKSGWSYNDKGSSNRERHGAFRAVDNSVDAKVSNTSRSFVGTLHAGLFFGFERAISHCEVEWC